MAQGMNTQGKFPGNKSAGQGGTPLNSAAFTGTDNSKDARKQRKDAGGYGSSGKRSDSTAKSKM